MSPSQKRNMPWRMTSTPILLSLIFILLSLLSTSEAFIIFETDRFRELAQKGQIDVDPRPEPPRPQRFLQRRQADEETASIPEALTMVPTSTDSESASTSTSASSDSEVTTTSRSSSTTTASASASTSSTTTGTRPAITVETTTLPSPFDTSLGSNFTSTSCPAFFNIFLSNITFQSCVPLSLLMQNSRSFFEVQRSTTLLAQTLDAACGAPLAICSPLMASIAADLILPTNCGQDFERQNPLVTQAYTGLVAYEPLYRATCLHDEDTGAYCYANAVTNSSSPSDPYPYYTALGMNLPAAAAPSCTRCLEQTMEIFASYAESAAQPLSRTYLSCASQIDQACGADFADTNVQAGALVEEGGAAGLRWNGWVVGPVTALVMLAVVW